jgi:hypothetical protein
LFLIAAALMKTVVRASAASSLSTELTQQH